jgi:hypothetical protein
MVLAIPHASPSLHISLPRHRLPGKAAAPQKKDAKGAKGVSTLDNAPNILPGNKLVPDPAMAPTHFIEVREALFRT